MVNFHLSADFDEDAKYIDWALMDLNELRLYRTMRLSPRFPGLSDSSAETVTLDKMTELVEGGGSVTASSQLHAAHSKYYQVEAPDCAKYEKLIGPYLGAINAFFDNFVLPIPDTIKIHLTSYGPGGSYNPGQTTGQIFEAGYTHVVVRPDGLSVNGLNGHAAFIANLVHETVHVIIEWPIVNRMKLSHENKEGLVDLLCSCDQLNDVCAGYKGQGYSAPKPLPPLEMLFKEDAALTWKGRSWEEIVA